MSGKHKEAAAPLNEWDVRLRSGGSIRIEASRVRRDSDGGYVFTTANGLLADFPPGTVEYVRRAPALVTVYPGTAGSGSSFAGVTAGGGRGGSAAVTGATGSNGR